MPLGALNAAVPDRMLSKLGISAGEADMTLEGPTWTIRDGHRVLYEWQARYDGAGLRLAQTPADILGASAPQSPHTSTSATVISTPPTPTPSISSSSQAASQVPGLLACVVAAHRDVPRWWPASVASTPSRVGAAWWSPIRPFGGCATSTRRRRSGCPTTSRTRRQTDEHRNRRPHGREPRHCPAHL